jgi:hypothetical protein
MKEIQKRSFEQIFQEIIDISTTQQDLIVSLCKLSNKDVTFYAMSLKT